MIRSERAALDRLCPGEMPNIPGCDVVDERYIEAPQSGRLVDRSTGTIIEGEVVEALSSPQPQTFANIGALLTAAAKAPPEGMGWGKLRVLQELGVKSTADIADLANAWNSLILAHKRAMGAVLDRVAASEEAHNCPPMSQYDCAAK